jgi:hypothetical protein
VARRGRTAGLIAAAVATAGCLLSASAGAGTGTLNLRYTSSTTTWIELPGRDSQDTYQPCFGAESLVGIGAWVGESVLPPPYETQFKVGKVFNVAIRPTNEGPGAPNPDANHQVTDNLFKQDHDIDFGEDTICAASAGQPVYPSAKKDSKAGKRTTVKVDCPNGTAVLSGGGSANGPFKSQRLVETAPFDDKLDLDTTPDDGWRAAVDNVSKKDRKAKVFAICGNIASLHYDESNFEVVQHTRRNYQLACPGGEYVLGGGVTPGVGFGKTTLVASRYEPVAGPSSWITEVDNLSNSDRVGTIYVICHA